MIHKFIYMEAATFKIYDPIIFNTRSSAHEYMMQRLEKKLSGPKEENIFKYDEYSAYAVVTNPKEPDYCGYWTARIVEIDIDE